MDIGAQLPALTFQVTRADLVRYAGAAGDFNPIHWSDRIATTVGLPGVIAHGMLTMALAAQALVEWTGDPASVVEYTVRFTKPVIVPDDDTGTEIFLSGDAPTLTEDGHARVELSAASAGEKVFGRGSYAVLRRTRSP